MSDNHNGSQLGQDAAAALGPEGDLVAEFDMAGFAGSMLAVLNRAMEHPIQVGAASLRLGATMARIAQFTLARVAGTAAEPPIAAGRDKRFTDPAWTDNPGFAALLQYYLATRQFSDQVLELGRGDQVTDAKAGLAASFLLDALSPTNFLLTNPAALKRAFETTGSARSPCSTRCWITANPGSWARSPTRRPWPVWNGRWRPRACWRAARWPVLSTCCAPTTSSSITSSPAG